MLTVEQAYREVTARARALPACRLPVAEALGCVLAEEVRADLDLPPFDKALVDGYAIRASDLSAFAAEDGKPMRLKIGEEITAGRTPSRPLGKLEAAFVMTGAPLPEGADAVVMHEQTTRDDDGRVQLDVPAVSPGQNRLVRGREMRSGEVVLEPGVRLNPPRLGLLASVGRTRVDVIPQPKVAVLATGDELVEPDRMPGPGQIRNSNATLLGALAKAEGAHVRTLPIAPDEPKRLRELLSEGLQADVLLVAGGVSAGKLDLVPSTLEALGVACVFHKIRLKPGKPLWFGVGPQRAAGRLSEGASTPLPGTLVFGLPGNPVSGMVGFLLFVRPALAALSGRPAAGQRLRQARLAEPFAHRGDRPTYHPAVWVRGQEDAEARVRPLDWAGSADLRTVAQAEGFAVFPAGDRDYHSGDPVEFLSLADQFQEAGAGGD